MRSFRNGFEQIYDNNYNKYLSYINNSHQHNVDMSNNIFNFDDLLELFYLKNSETNNNTVNSLNDESNNSSTSTDQENKPGLLSDFDYLGNEKLNEREQDSNYLNKYTNYDSTNKSNLDEELLNIKLRLEKFNSIFFNKELLDTNYSNNDHPQNENYYPDNIRVEDISIKIRSLIEKINHIKGDNLFFSNQKENISSPTRIDYSNDNLNTNDKKLENNNLKNFREFDSFSSINTNDVPVSIKNRSKQNLNVSNDSFYLETKNKSKISQNKLINIVKNVD